MDRRRESDVSNLRWRDLYRLGSIACVALPVSTALATGAYFIWPYAPDSTDVESIFLDLQSNRLAGLLSLDLSTIVIAPLMVIQILAVYVALKRVNESFNSVALVFGLMGTLLVFADRPLAEMSYLSDQFASATTRSGEGSIFGRWRSLKHAFYGNCLADV